MFNAKVKGIDFLKKINVDTDSIKQLVIGDVVTYDERDWGGGTSTYLITDITDDTITLEYRLTVTAYPSI